jgi:hypothetical protein
VAEVETPETPETEEGAEAGEPKVRPTVASSNPLSRDSDHAIRPGFRSPANAKSKASKKKRKKR